MYQDSPKVVEYLEEEHIYLIQGRIVSSVTQLLKKKFPLMYEKIPASILEKASKRGTAIHEAIECDGTGQEIPQLTIYEELCFKEYLRLKKEHSIVPIENEKIVHYKALYGGTLDLLCTIDGELTLVDVKTTSKVHDEYLSWQLSLYELALKDMGYDKEIKSFKCLWLPKGKLGKLVDVKRIDEKELQDFLGEIEK